MSAGSTRPPALRRRARVVLQTLVPEQAHPVLTKGIEGVRFDDFYADFAANASGKLLLSFRASLFLAIWVAPLLVGRIPPITRHRADVRRRILDRFFASRIALFRQIALTMKFVVSLCYGADDDVRRAVGLPAHYLEIDATP
ncbi:MAG TPA: hypothetical protein VFK89_05750 [Actinomycetota bacterium]|nr:hypothetical protein [Actinomycetota bacterium]